MAHIKNLNIVNMYDFYPFTVGVRSPTQILSELLCEIITCITKV